MHGLFAMAFVVASGHVVEQSRNVGNFTGVEVAAGIHARIDSGAAGPITVRAEDDVIGHVRTVVAGSTLTIGFEPNSNIRSRATVEVFIRMPRADLLGASGGAEIEANVAAADALRLDASGGSHIRLTSGIKPQKLDATASGGAEISISGTDSARVRLHGSGGATLTVAGRAQEATVELSGGTDVHAGNLQVASLEVHGSGGGDAEVNAAQRVRGSLSGGATLRVPGSANVDVHTSGGAEVIRK